jgi:hypothetical protein
MYNEQWWYRHCVAMFIFGGFAPQSPHSTTQKYLFFYLE